MSMTDHLIFVEEFEGQHPRFWAIRYPSGRSWTRRLFDTEAEAIKAAIELQETAFPDLNISWRGFNSHEPDPFHALRHFSNI